jgi:hypothetical protein
LRETIYNYEDLLEMLDSLLREPTEFWDTMKNINHPSDVFGVSGLLTALFQKY